MKSQQIRFCRRESLLGAGEWLRRECGCQGRGLFLRGAGVPSLPLSFEWGRGRGVNGEGEPSLRVGKKRKCTRGRVPFGTGVIGQGHTPISFHPLWRSCPADSVKAQNQSCRRPVESAREKEETRLALPPQPSYRSPGVIWGHSLICIRSGFSLRPQSLREASPGAREQLLHPHLCKAKLLRPEEGTAPKGTDGFLPQSTAINCEALSY